MKSISNATLFLSRPPRSVLILSIAALFSLQAGWAELAYRGIAPGLLQVHISRTESLLAHWERGESGLDGVDSASFARPMLRRLPPLAYVAAAGLVKCFPALSPTLAVRGLLLLAFLAIGPLLFFFLRRLGATPLAALFPALCASFCSSPPGCLSLGFASFSIFGPGAFSTAVALPCSLFMLAWLARPNDWASRSRFSQSLNDAGLGFGLGVLFLLSPTLTLLTIFAAVIFGRKRSLAQITWRRVFLGTLTFFSLTAFQWLSLWQDSSLGLVHEETLMTGVSPLGFFRGQLLDADRWPVLTLFAVVGLALSTQKGAAFSTRRLGLLFVFALSGLAIFPDGSQSSVAFSLLLQVAALGVMGGIFAGAFARGSEWFRLRGFLFGTAFVLASIPLAISYRAVRAEHGRNLRQLRLMAKIYGTRFFNELRAHSGKGRVWIASSPTPSPRPGARPGLFFGPFAYASLAEGSGLDALSTEDASPLDKQDPLEIARSAFSIEREDHAELFDVASALVPPGRTLPAKWRELGRTPSLVSYLVGHPGPFGITSCCEVSTLNPDAHAEALLAWMSASSADRCKLALPSAIAGRWPTAIPRVFSTTESAQFSVRNIRTQNLPARYEAELTSANEGRYGFLRVAFHPRWRARVNGVVQPAVWITPGYLGFALPPGVSRVAIDFPEDPWRRALAAWSLGTFSLFMTLAACCQAWRAVAHIQLDPRRHRATASPARQS